MMVKEIVNDMVESVQAMSSTWNVLEEVLESESQRSLEDTGG